MQCCQPKAVSFSRQVFQDAESKFWQGRNLWSPLPEAPEGVGAHPFALQDDLLHRTPSILICHGALLVAYLSVM